MSKEKTDIGKSIRKHRLKKELSLEKLARLADLSFPTIAKIESGETPNPTIETIKRIASALEVSIDDLVE